MYRDLAAAHERIQQLEAELAKANKLLARLLKGKWLAKLFGYKVYVDCEHSHYCQSFETMASGIASGKVKVYRQSSSRYCGPHPALVTNDARYEHCRICGARFGHCEHVKLDNSDLDGLLAEAAQGTTLGERLRAWDEGLTIEDRLGGGQSNKALMKMMKLADQVANPHPGTMKVMVVSDGPGGYLPGQVVQVPASDGAALREGALFKVVSNDFGAVLREETTLKDKPIPPPIRVIRDGVTISPITGTSVGSTVKPTSVPSHGTRRIY